MLSGGKLNVIQFEASKREQNTFNSRLATPVVRKGPNGTHIPSKHQ